MRQNNYEVQIIMPTKNRIKKSRPEQEMRKAELRQERRERKIESEITAAKTREFTQKAKETSDGVDSRWWKLDNAALIYPSNTSKNWPAVFRIAVYLKEPVKPGVLQQAVDDVMQRFPFFNVRMRKGIFWYYFEEMPFPPVVKKEYSYPCKQFDLSAKRHLLRIMHHNNKISVEFFHSLCDGKGAFKYLTTLLARYFILQGINIEENDNFLNYLDLPRKDEVEDAFERYADLKDVNPRPSKPAYQIKGTPLERGQQLVYTILLDTNEFKAAAKSHSATLTEYTLAVILQACNKQRKFFKDFKRPVGIQMPIDIRRYFETDTLRNFSSYKFIMLPEDFKGDFGDLILFIRKEIAEIDKDYLLRNINANVKPQKNKIIRAVPLAIKNIALKISARRYGDRLVTTTLSNIGPIDAPPEFKDLISFYECLLGVNKYNKFAVTCCSYNNKMAMAFSSKIIETDIFADIFKSFADDGIKIEMISNKEV